MPTLGALRVLRGNGHQGSGLARLSVGGPRLTNKIYEWMADVVDGTRVYSKFVGDRLKNVVQL